MTADGLGQRMDPVGQRGDNPEIAVASAAQRPQQIGVAGLVGPDRQGVVGPGGHDDLGCQQVVRRHAEAAGEQPEAAAERCADDTDRSLGPGRHRVAGPAESVDHFRLAESGTDGGGTGHGVDGHGLQLADVDHHPVVDAGPALQAVSTTADPDRDAAAPGPGHSVDDVPGFLREDDRRRSVGKQQVPARGGGGVVTVVRTDDPAGQLTGTGGDGGHPAAFGAAANSSSPGSDSNTSRLKIIIQAK